MDHPDLAAIDKAIKKGALRVKFSDREVTYNSIDDLLKARKFLMAKLNQVDRRPVRFSVATFDD